MTPDISLKRKAESELPALSPKKKAITFESLPLVLLQYIFSGFSLAELASARAVSRTFKLATEREWNDPKNIALRIQRTEYKHRSEGLETCVDILLSSLPDELQNKRSFYAHIFTHSSNLGIKSFILLLRRLFLDGYHLPKDLEPTSSQKVMKSIAVHLNLLSCSQELHFPPTLYLAASGFYTLTDIAKLVREKNPDHLFDTVAQLIQPNIQSDLQITHLDILIAFTDTLVKVRNLSLPQEPLHYCGEVLLTNTAPFTGLAKIQNGDESLCFYKGGLRTGFEICKRGIRFDITYYVNGRLSGPSMREAGSSSNYLFIKDGNMKVASVSICKNMSEPKEVLPLIKEIDPEYLCQFAFFLENAREFLLANGKTGASAFADLLFLCKEILSLAQIPFDIKEGVFNSRGQSTSCFLINNRFYTLETGPLSGTGDAIIEGICDSGRFYYGDRFRIN